MKHDAVREAVRDRYGRIAEEADEAKAEPVNDNGTLYGIN